MSKPLEKFVQENRDQFDADTPDPRVWDKINERMNPSSKKETPVRSLPFSRWVAAAAAAVLIGLTSVVYFSLHKNKTAEVAGTNPEHIDSGNHLPSLNTVTDTAAQIAKKAPVAQKTNPALPEQEDAKETPETGASKEMFYYAKLIELKHEELKTLEKDEPLLYRQFSGDVQKLDSVYHSLKTQLPDNSNQGTGD